MVNFATSTAGSIPHSANEAALETSVPSTERELRYQRIQQLRDAIGSRQYSVSAGELADALLRAARRTN